MIIYSDEDIILENLAAEVYNFLKQHQALNHAKRPFNKSPEVNFLAKYLSLTLYAALNIQMPASMTQDQKVEAIHKNLGLVKSDIQEAVVMAFQEEMTRFSGKPIEYYCQIAPVPNPINQVLC